MLANYKAIHAVWAMEHKSWPDGTLLNHKSCLCAHGHWQVFEINYPDTNSSFVKLANICLIFIFASIEDFHTCQVDFVLVFSQVALRVLVYMQLPQEFIDELKTHILLLEKP